MKRIKGLSTAIKSRGSVKGASEDINLLPLATAEHLGAIKVGSGVSITTDGTLSVSGGGSSINPGNPTASVGLSAVNGTASTYMRSDAAPALDQSISPTWTGTHTYSGSILVPTPGKGDNSTKAASTAFVQSALTANPSVNGANPSAKVGTQPVNGTATTYMRSDAAPALDLSINPTWTGAHTYSSSISVPTQKAGDSSTNAASTSFVATTVQTAVSSIPKLQPATANNLGGVIIGSGITVQPNGTISVNSSEVINPANPSAKVGLSAVDGSATTYMRSDAAPTLDQSINPSWTGTHAFSGAITVPTKTAGDNATNAASTAFVTNAVQTAVASIPKMQPATATTLGGVKVGSGIQVQGDGTISVDSSETLSAANPTAKVGLSTVDGSATTYMRSDASPALDLTINPTWAGEHTFNGSVYVPTSQQSDNSTKAASTAFVTNAIANIPSYTLPLASASTLGGIKVGKGLDINGDGTLSATDGGSYVLPQASNDTLGGIKVGDGLQIDNDSGVLSTSPLVENYTVGDRGNNVRTINLEKPINIITLPIIGNTDFKLQFPVGSDLVFKQMDYFKIVVCYSNAETPTIITFASAISISFKGISNDQISIDWDSRQNESPFVIEVYNGTFANGLELDGAWFVSGHFLYD